MNPIIISGFPGIGKTTFKNELWERAKTQRNILADGFYEVVDSDSSTFPKDSFPQNYIRHIEQLYTTRITKYILVSSHDVVRAALVKQRLPFILVYPHRHLKWPYMNRYFMRGSPPEFQELMSQNWYKFLDSCEQQKDCTHYILGEDENLSDAIPAINGIALANENH